MKAHTLLGWLSLAHLQAFVVFMAMSAPVQVCAGFLVAATLLAISGFALSTFPYDPPSPRKRT